MEERSVKEWKDIVAPALKSKRGEFKLIGYDDVSTEKIWQCLEKQVWRNNPKKRLHEVVEDIFHLSTSTYMNFMTVKALKSDKDDLMASIQAVTEGEK